MNYLLYSCTVVLAPHVSDPEWLLQPQTSLAVVDKQDGVSKNYLKFVDGLPLRERSEVHVISRIY